MTTLKRGLIIDVNLDPTQGSETGKIRPCVIVTNKHSIVIDSVIFKYPRRS